MRLLIIKSSEFSLLFIAVVMPDKCCVVGCKTNYIDGPKNSVLYFPQDEELKKKWIRFVNRKNWTPTKHSVICAERFSDDRSFFKGVVCFMVVGLKRSVPIVVKAVPETSGSGNFIAENLMDIISKLARIGFNVRGTVCDDHSSNVNAYSKLSKSYGKDGAYIIHHPTYEGMLKTYLLFDSAHLIKNSRNNLLCGKQLVFPTFEFNNLRDTIYVPNGYVDWALLHSVYEKDQNLEAHLKKAQ